MERLSTSDLLVKAICEFVFKVSNFMLACPVLLDGVLQEWGLRTLFPLRLSYEKDTFISLLFRVY